MEAIWTRFQVRLFISVRDRRVCLPQIPSILQAHRPRSEESN